MTEKTSGLKFYSLGIVIENKQQGTDKIKVYPVEELPLLNGLVKDTKISYVVNSPDHQGIMRQESAEGKAEIVADWISLGESNRMTSPDVRANETVLILKMADTAKYYWTALMREPSLRRQEIVNYSYSNLPSGMDPFDKDSSYWIEWDTINKRVQLHTSNNDGEPFKFDLTFAAGDGSVSLSDDVGNTITMDSKNDIININSIAGANVTLEKGHIKMHGITITATADEKITLRAPEIEMSEKLTMTGDSTFNGKVDVNGLASLNEGVAGKGGAKFSGGDFETEGGNVKLAGGDITMTGGAITANGEDLNVDLT